MTKETKNHNYTLRLYVVTIDFVEQIMTIQTETETVCCDYRLRHDIQSMREQITTIVTIYIYGDCIYELRLCTMTKETENDYRHD